MEDQAEYKTKNRPFHGDYTSPGQARLDESVGQARLYESVGQGKRPEQYESSMAIFAWLTCAFFGMMFFVGLYTFCAWLWSQFIKHWISALFVLAVTTSCSPGQMVGTGYLVTIEEGIQMKWDRVETAEQADQFIFEKTGLVVKTDSLIGTTYPYWDMKNGRKYFYVERKGIYQRRENGKKRWRVYDEQLEILNNE